MLRNNSYLSVFVGNVKILMNNSLVFPKILQVSCLRTLDSRRWHLWLKFVSVPVSAPYLTDSVLCMYKKSKKISRVVVVAHGGFERPWWATPKYYSNVADFFSFTIKDLLFYFLFCQYFFQAMEIFTSHKSSPRKLLSPWHHSVSLAHLLVHNEVHGIYGPLISETWVWKKAQSWTRDISWQKDIKSVHCCVELIGIRFTVFFVFRTRVKYWKQTEKKIYSILQCE